PSSAGGHRLAVALVFIAAAAALSALVLAGLEARLEVPAWLKRAFAAMLLVAILAGVGGALVHYGSPSTIVRRGYQSFKVPEPAGTQPSERVFDLSGNGRDAEWRVAWRDSRLHPWLGSGAGTYEQNWLKLRDVSGHARDAHNLYLEVLAELGPLGLVLLGVALGAPLVAGLGARHGPLVPAA